MEQMGPMTKTTCTVAFTETEYKVRVRVNPGLPCWVNPAPEGENA